MKIGKRCQVTIPKDIREQFGLRPDTEVNFRVADGAILLEKAPRKLDLHKWKGRCKYSFAALGYSPRGKARVDRFLEDVRGR
jgi:AbrB family looped-hinge helix DNA binding protein